MCRGLNVFKRISVPTKGRAKRDEIHFLFSKNRIATENADKIVNEVIRGDFTESALKVLKVAYTNLFENEKELLSDLKLELEKAYDVDQNLHHEQITDEEFDQLKLYISSKEELK